MTRDVLSRRVYYREQTIFREGELGNILYVIERGSVVIWRGPPELRVEIATIPKGGLFGEMAIFDGKPRMASATALEETVVVQIDGTYVREALRRSDPIVARLVQVIIDSARGLGEQLHDAHRTIDTLRRKSAPDADAGTASPKAP